MAINNGDEVNSNTEVDNVVSATFYFVFEKTNLEVFAESLERGNFVIKFPPSATFQREARQKWKQAVADKTNLGSNLMKFSENANPHPETLQYQPGSNIIILNAKHFN